MNAPVRTSGIAKKAHVWERDELDWYQEPQWVTTALAVRERFVGSIWDPACGGGNVVRALIAAGCSAYGTDIVHRGLGFTEGWRGEHDFLSEGLPRDSRFRLPPNLVFNAPFYRAVGTENFIRRALVLATGKVAAFIDIRFLASARRAGGLYAEHPPVRIYILGKRPSCPPGSHIAGGGKAEGGTADWAWLVWDQSSPRHATTLDWIVGSGESACATA